MKRSNSTLRSGIVVLILLVGRIQGIGNASTPEKYGTPAKPISKVHEKIACAQCHSPTGDVPAQKCLVCHKGIVEAVKSGRGLHAASAVSQKPCANCHVDHRGVDADIRGWAGVGNRQGLDHALTAFPLTGKHASLSCQECHPRIDAAGNPRFPDNSRTCLPCHKDGHQPSLGMDCRGCHAATTWAVENFDHNRRTHFVLTGKHEQAAQHKRCAPCHPGATQVWKPIPMTCSEAACHGRDDAHKGQFGNGCGDCHNTSEWRQARNAVTGHNLAPQRFGGAHDRIACGQCHTGARTLRGLAGACISCHQRDDIHHNSLGPRCGDCHTQQTFAGARFHHESVGCSLRGVHRVLPCLDCHKGGNYAGLSPLCISCHRDDAMRAVGVSVVRNPLNPAVPELHAVQTACTNCHNTLSFRMGAGTRQSPPESVCQ